MSKDKEENLHIDTKIRELVVKALNRSTARLQEERYEQAAKLLGVSSRTLYRYIKSFNITTIYQ